MLRVAYEKAQKVGNLFPDKWIIGADTVVVHRGRVLGKPKTEDRCLHHAEEIESQLAQGLHRLLRAQHLDGRSSIRMWRKPRSSSRI